jgi:hypothetical protein
VAEIVVVTKPSKRLEALYRLEIKAKLQSYYVHTPVTPIRAHWAVSA